MGALSKAVNIKYTVDSRNAKRGLDDLAKGTESVRVGAEKSSSSLMGMAGSMVGPAGVIAAVAGTVAVMSELNSKALELAERSAQVSAVFQNAPIPIEAARRATAGLIADYDLARLASDAVSLGVTQNAKDFGELSGALQKLGARRGVDALQSIEDGFTAIGRGSKEMLDNLGITLSISQAQQQYAQDLGKTVKELDDVERAEAFRVVATRKVIDAAKDVTLTTDDASSAVRRFNIELQNIEDRALGGGVATLSLADGLRQISAESAIDVEALKTYGGAVADLRNELRDLGVASTDLPGTMEELAKAAKNANVEISRLRGLEDLRRQEQAKDPAFQQEQKRLAAEKASLETARLRVREIEEERAFLSHNNDAIAAKAALQIESLQLQAKIVRATGDEAKARQIERQAELAQLTELSRIANLGGRRRGRRRDPNRAERLLFQQQLTEAINAERLREFSDAVSLQRTYLADVQRFETELSAARQPSIDRFALEKERAEFMAEFEQNTQQRRLELALAMAETDTQRFALRQAAFDERESQLTREIELEANRDEKQRLMDQREQVRHEARLDRIEEERRAREEHQRSIVNAINAVDAAQRGSLQLTSTIVDATIDGESRKKSVLDGIKAAGLYADGAVAAAKSGIAFASGNVPQGIALAAAAANAFAQGTKIAAGNAGPGGGGSPTAAGSAFARGDQPQQEVFRVDRGAPLSVREDVEGNANNTGGPGSSGLDKGTTININELRVAGAIDDETIRQFKQGLARAEGNLGV